MYNVGTGLFEPAPHVPDGFNSGAITIRNGHTIIINNNIPASADEMTIEAGAQVFVGLGGLTILDGYDLDLSLSTKNWSCLASTHQRRKDRRR